MKDRHLSKANDDDVHVKCALSKVLKNVTFETTKLETWFLVISKRCLKWFGKVGNKSVSANSCWDILTVLSTICV